MPNQLSHPGTPEKDNFLFLFLFIYFFKVWFVFFFKILFIYSTEIETASKSGNTSRGRGGRSRLPAEKPDVGLDPRTLGSHPEPKADA